MNDQGEIVYGLGAIKGVGEGPASEIVKVREQGGAFKDLFDFCARVDMKRFNKRVLEKLILSGSFDKLGPHRAALMATLEEAMRRAEQLATNQQSGFIDMFGLVHEPESAAHQTQDVEPWPDSVWLEG